MILRRMHRRLLLLALIGIAGLLVWIGRSPSSSERDSNVPAAPSSASSAALPAKPIEPLSASVEPVRAPSRSEAAPAEPVATPQTPAETPAPASRPGQDVDAIFGGPEAFTAFYREIDKVGRLSRVQQLEAALAEYESDPKDPREREKVTALKDELLWLRANPGE